MKANDRNTYEIEVLHKSELKLGGFAGIKEHRLVTDTRLFNPNVKRSSWEGIGQFVYLADATFVPYGETGDHPHHEVDVISVIVEGRVAHGGSLEDGEVLSPPDVQVQRAGGEGFRHNERNPDGEPNRMIQLWVLPEHSGERAGYKLYRPEENAVTRIYGGDDDQTDTFASSTLIDIVMLDVSEEYELEGSFVGYVTKGKAEANGVEIEDGHLIRGESLRLRVTEDFQMILIYES